MKILVRIVYSIITAMVVSCALCACDTSQKRQVMVMWNTDDTDPAYKVWTEMLADEFRRQGIEAEIHPYYGEIGMSREGKEYKKIIRMVHGLDSLGKRPDLILAHGDYTHWNLLLNDDSLVSSIPVVAFGLKDGYWLPYQEAYLEQKGITRNNIVHIYDSLCLKENIDLAAFLHNLHREGDTIRRSPLYRFVSLLDRQSVWIDSIIGINLRAQAEQLDTVHYLNCIDNPSVESNYRELNNAGIAQYSIYSMKSPVSNPHVSGITTTWVFYSQKSLMRFIQAKHDETTRSCTEGPNFSPYTTMTAEDFLVNDSCMGGYFVSAETLLGDAVKAGARLLQGETAAQIGDSHHTPSYHINWNILRKKGFSISQMPDYIKLHNTTLHDRNPLLADLLYALYAILAVIFIGVSAVYSIRSLHRLRLTSREMDRQAKQAIEDEQFLELALATSKAVMFDDRDGKSFRERLIPDEEFREQVDRFFAKRTNGITSVQFHGSIDGQEPHWYDIRMELHHDEGQLSHSGFAINIDHLMKIREEAQQAHQLFMEAKTREGFIGAMSHEIRTPLHAVVGFSLELARPGVKFAEEEIAIFAEYIESNAASLKKIINDILLVTLLGHSNVSAKCRQCTIQSLLSTRNWPDAMALTARRRNVVEIMPGGEEVTLNADPKMMNVVMENLIINASLFSKEGSHITIGWNTDDEHHTQIWVQDEGIGIDAKYHQLIFERFFKIDSFHPGCGLGLYICKTYMEKMNGTIRCESEKGKGARLQLIINN